MQNLSNPHITVNTFLLPRVPYKYAIGGKKDGRFEWPLYRMMIFAFVAFMSSYRCTQDEISHRLQLDQKTFRKHIRVFKNLGLIELLTECDKRGQYQTYRLTRKGSNLFYGLLKRQSYFKHVFSTIFALVTQLLDFPRDRYKYFAAEIITVLTRYAQISGHFLKTRGSLLRDLDQNNIRVAKRSDKKHQDHAENADIPTKIVYNGELQAVLYSKCRQYNFTAEVVESDFLETINKTNFGEPKYKVKLSNQIKFVENFVENRYKYRQEFLGKKRRFKMRNGNAQTQANDNFFTSDHDVHWTCNYNLTHGQHQVDKMFEETLKKLIEKAEKAKEQEFIR